MPPMGPGPRRMPANGKKEKTDIKAIKKLVIYSKKYFPAIIVSVIFAILSSVTSIIGPDYIQDLITCITNGITTNIDFTKFTSLAVTLVIIYVIGAFAGYFQQLIMNISTQRLSRKMRTDINNKLERLPLSYYDTTSRGDILSIVTNDVDTISQSLGQSIASLFQSTVLFFGVIIMMFKTSWILALTTILASVLGFVFISIISAKSQKHFNVRQQTLADMNSDVEEIYTNHSLVRGYNAVDSEIDKFEEINARLYNANRKSQFLGGMMMPIMNFAGNLSFAAIYIVGITIFIANGSNDMTILGTLVSFTIYARLFSQPLQTFAQSITSIQQASSASSRVFRYLEEKEIEDETNKTLELKDVKGDVEFSHIKFSYNKDKEIIHDFSAKVKAGSKIAIVGPTGAGKTTLVNLLMRFYEINDGTITIDGIDTKSVKRENVRDQFDMILQDTWLFKGTLRENLVYNNPSIKDSDVMLALKAVGLSHYVETLPLGLDTIIDEKISLSEGQKQELTIARAILRNAPMLILDEATSNVDTRTELVIQNAMDNLMKGRTSFVIAHRLSTIKNADLILVLNHGDVVEMGNHKELLKKGGFYSDLYNSQFETFE